MRVFVTGATGAIGRHVVPALIRDGHTVTALARTADKAAALQSQGATPTGVSLFDRAALGRAFAGHDAVVNLATSLPSTARFMSYRAWHECERIRTEGSAAVADAAVAAAVPRLLQESVCMLYRDGGDNWLDETSPTDSYRIARGNLAAEASAHRFGEGGGTAIVLRFGLFYGPGATHSEQTLASARRHIAFVAGRPDSFLSSIHVHDGATAVSAALDAPGGTYNVVDDRPMTKIDFANACARAAQARTWVRGPGRLGYLLGDRLTSLTRSLRVSNQLVRAETGWRPEYPSADEGWIATARELTGDAHRG